jgi:hypothetical protein
VIIRVMRVQLAAGTSEAFREIVSGAGFARLASRDGLLHACAAFLGVDQRRGVVVTFWRSFEDLLAVAGGDLDQLICLPPDSGLDVAGSVTHWEGLDMPAIGSRLEPSVLRLLTGRVRIGGEAEYFSCVRNHVWPVLARTPGLTGAAVGRQAGQGEQSVVAVSLWSSLLDVVAAGGHERPLFGDEGRELVEYGVVEHYDIFARIGEAARGLTGDLHDTGQSDATELGAAPALFWSGDDVR